MTDTVGAVRAKEPATGTFNGDPFVINPSTILAPDHELVRAFPHLFKPIEPERDRPLVEAMTAAPGEKRGEPVKRGPGRPRKQQ